MSSRFLKKVTQTYGNKVDIIDNIEENDSSDGECVPNFSNKFDMLQIESGSDEEKVDDQKIIDLEAKFDNVGSTKKMKPKKSKAKKQNIASKFQEMTEDELLDQFNNSIVQSLAKDDNNNSSCDALSIKIRNLNENLELQQMFGPSAAGTTSSADHGRRNNHVSLIKCTFGKRGADWPQVSVSKLGLKMERLGDSSSVYNWCLVTCTDQYVRGERALKTVMRTGNYQDHMREWPYHINTLLQMAMLLINQEDFTLAADILKRIFYVYETISPMGLSLLGFSSGGSLSRCNCSLDYKYRLNRGIFIALFQWIHYLCQRSCFSTALEYCKVILNLNIINDPLAMILMIDDIAIRGNQFDFLIQFYNQFNSTKSLMFLPNFAFSLALCHFLKSSNDKSKKTDFSQADALLQSALCRFPTFLMTFIDNCSIKVDDRISRCSFFTNNNDSQPLDVLIKLYMKRSINLWKNSSVLRWVECNVQRLLDRFQSDEELILSERKQILDIYKRVIPLAIKRHIFLSGHGELIQQNELNTTSLIFDPFPPANSDGGFDHYVESDAPAELDDSWLMNLFRSFMPSFR